MIKVGDTVEIVHNYTDLDFFEPGTKHTVVHLYQYLGSSLAPYPYYLADAEGATWPFAADEVKPCLP